MEPALRKQCEDKFALIKVFSQLFCVNMFFKFRNSVTEIKGGCGHQHLILIFRPTVEIEVGGGFTEFFLVIKQSTLFDDMKKMNFSLRDVDDNIIFERQYTIRVGMYFERFVRYNKFFDTQIEKSES